MSHHFSLVQVEPGAMSERESREGLRKLASHGEAYRDHCLIMKLFPALQERWESTARQERTGDFVFRARSVPAGGDARTLSYYLVSRERPEAVDGLLRVEVKQYSPQLAIGEVIRFHLRANPSVTRSRRGALAANGGKRRPQHDVLMMAKRGSVDPQTQAERMDRAAGDWLLERAPGWGLKIEKSTLFVDGYTQHRLRRGGEGICFSSVDYTGIGEVIDPMLLHNAMVQGVGRKRSFGCGLLLVRRFD